MRKSFLFFSVLASLLLTFSVAHATPLLGPAADYSLFVFGNMEPGPWSDSQGRVAVGGNITLSSFSIALLAAPAEYSVVSGGNVNFASGHVYNGGIFAGGNIQLNNFGVDGDVTANGTITYGPGGVTVAGDSTPNAAAVSPVDFASEYSYLSSTSLALAAMTPTGTTSVTPWHAITLTGTEDINIFNLDGNALSNATSLKFNIGADAIAIVNVSGSADGLGNFAISGYDGKQGNILYNFYDADLLTIHNIAVQGSILAPDADVIFNSGQINGTLIAGSLTGTGQSNLYLFDHDLFDHNSPVRPVPEPATIILLGAGLAGVFVVGKKIK
jgi:choice-of-anchor A domain-containing protein